MEQALPFTFLVKKQHKPRPSPDTLGGCAIQVQVEILGRHPKHSGAAPHRSKSNLGRTRRTRGLRHTGPTQNPRSPPEALGGCAIQVTRKILGRHPKHSGTAPPRSKTNLGRTRRTRGLRHTGPTRKPRSPPEAPGGCAAQVQVKVLGRTRRTRGLRRTSLTRYTSATLEALGGCAAQV